MRGHANCVRFVKSFGLPTLLLGGGGYTMRNVSRAWAYETGIAAGYELGADLPVNEYYDYFGPDYKLDVRSSNMEDRNSIEYLERIKNVVMEHLREIGGPPSVQMSDIPRVPMFDDVDLNETEDTSNPKERPRMQLWDKKTKRDDDLSDSEDEGEGGRQFEKDQSTKTSSKKPSGEVSMDISKAPSPTVGCAGAATLDSGGLGLSLDTPGTSKVGGIGDMAAPSLGGAAAPSLGGMETVNTILGAVGNTGLGDSRYEDVMGQGTERDVEMDG